MLRTAGKHLSVNPFKAGSESYTKFPIHADSKGRTADTFDVVYLL